MIMMIMMMMKMMRMCVSGNLTRSVVVIGESFSDFYPLGLF